MPNSFDHLSIWIIHNSISMKFTIRKLSFIYFTIVPCKRSNSMNFSILKWSLINSSLCSHFSLSDFQISWKFAYILAFSSMHCELSMTLHVSILKWTYIYFSVWPFVYCIVIIFNTVNKLTLISWSIRINLYSFSIWLVINPISLINEITCTRYKFSITF